MSDIRSGLLDMIRKAEKEINELLYKEKRFDEHLGSRQLTKDIEFIETLKSVMKRADTQFSDEEK